MKKKIFILLIFAVYLTAAQGQVPKALGTLDPFWRNNPVLGPYLEGGLWLYQVPNFLTQSDFPYVKRPYDKEVFFADGLTMVRILGGTDFKPGTSVKQPYPELDFAYKENGVLKFRPHLIRQRIKPYLTSGYEDLTIVLDNVPWGLVNTPIFGDFGQTAPPDSPEEWYETVKQLCITLRDTLGITKADALRFRLGTENQGYVRFASTTDRFKTHYDYASTAIKEILPNAKVGIYNVAGFSITGITTGDNVKSADVLAHLSTQNNRKTNTPNTPSSFVPVSQYFFEGDYSINNSNGAWNYITNNITGYNGTFTKEVHEFGALGHWNAAVPTNNPGAFGAALTLNELINLRAIGVKKLYHWNLVDALPSTSVPVVPISEFWFYSVLDYMKGGASYQIFPEVSSPALAHKYTAMLSVKANKAYLLISGFNASRTNHTEEVVTFKLPKSYFAFTPNVLKYASQTTQNSILDAIYRDLASSSQLKTAVVNAGSEYVTSIRSMADISTAVTMIQNNWTTYTQLWKNSLTLQENCGALNATGSYYTVKLKMTAPQCMVIVLE